MATKGGGGGAHRVLDELRVQLLQLHDTVLQERYWKKFADINFGLLRYGPVEKFREIYNTDAFTALEANFRKLLDQGMAQDQLEDELRKISEESEEAFTKIRMNMFLTNPGRSVRDMVAICKTSDCVDACLKSVEKGTELFISSSKGVGQIADENVFSMDHKKVIFDTLASDLQKQKGADSKEFAEDFVFILKKYIDKFGHTDEVLSMVSEIMVDVTHVIFPRSVVLYVRHQVVLDLLGSLAECAHSDIAFRHRVCNKMIAYPDLNEVSYLRLILHEMAYSRRGVVECRRDSSVIYACGLVDSYGSELIGEFEIDFDAFGYPRNHHACIVTMCDLCVSLASRRRPNQLFLVLPIDILLRVQKMICPCSAQEFRSEQELVEVSNKILHY